MSIQETLEERGKIYGSYNKHLEIRVKILDLLSEHKRSVRGKEFSKFEYIFFHDLVMKLVRLAGDPRHQDSAHDLAGYATLIENLIKQEVEDNAK